MNRKLMSLRACTPAQTAAYNDSEDWMVLV